MYRGYEMFRDLPNGSAYYATVKGGYADNYNDCTDATYLGAPPVDFDMRTLGTYEGMLCGTCPDYTYVIRMYANGETTHILHHDYTNVSEIAIAIYK